MNRFFTNSRCMYLWVDVFISCSCCVLDVVVFFFALLFILHVCGIWNTHIIIIRMWWQLILYVFYHNIRISRSVTGIIFISQATGIGNGRMFQLMMELHILEIAHFCWNVFSCDALSTWFYEKLFFSQTFFFHILSHPKWKFLMLEI